MKCLRCQWENPIPVLEHMMEAVHRHLTTATTMYREMDMRFWLERAESAVGERP